MGGGEVELFLTKYVSLQGSGGLRIFFKKYDLEGKADYFLQYRIKNKLVAMIFEKLQIPLSFNKAFLRSPLSGLTDYRFFSRFSSRRNGMMPVSLITSMSYLPITLFWHSGSTEAWQGAAMRS